MRWKLITNSSHRAEDGIEGEAKRLVSQLSVVARFVRDQYGFTPEWRSQPADAKQWQDLAAVAGIISQGVMLDESDPPQPWPELGYSGSVFAYHPETDEGVIDCHWRIGGDGAVGFHTSYGFEPMLNPFPHDREPESLVQLLVAAAGSVEADEARIMESLLQRAVRRGRREAAGRIGALMLVPDSRSIEQWPDRVTATPAPEGYPDGAIVFVDLAAVETPTDLVPTLLELDDLLMSA